MPKENNDLLCSECQGDQAIAQCRGCKNAISSTIRYIKYEKHFWHPECFKCVICQAWLADGQFKCNSPDSPMCADCFATKFGKKCAVCQDTITTKGVQHGLTLYHSHCFNCSSCNKNLTNETQVKTNDGQLICHECYVKQARKCFRCNGPITSRCTLHKGRRFHIECFKCNLCGSNIGGDEFYETSLSEIICANCTAIN